MARIYFEDKRVERAQLGTKVQHAFGGIPLLWSGIQNFREGAEVPMALLEIGIAVVVLAAFIKEVRAVVRPHSHSAHASHSVVGGSIWRRESFSSSKRFIVLITK